MESYFIGILISIFSIFTILFLKKQKSKLMLATLSTILTSLCVLISSIFSFIDGEKTLILNFGPIFQNVQFTIDNLSAFFLLFISIISSLVIVYSNGYLKPYIEKGKDITSHCVFLQMLILSMMGVVVCQNALFFLIIWELMSLSSFFLVIFENEKKDVLNAGIKYLIYMHISVIFIILCFALLSIKSSSLDFDVFKLVVSQNTQLANIIFVLGFIGFGIKAGFMPFHNWLPVAHPAAPSHVSALMSAVMIKTGIYGILRILTFLDVPSAGISYFVLLISILTALYAVLYAIAQSDIKKMLALSSIENIGIIGIGLGIGMLGMSYSNIIVSTLGFSGAILHILNHSIFKSLLFLSAGAVYNKTHTRDIEILGGLIKKMPKTAVIFLIGSVAICGLPLLNGFVSEFLIYFGLLKGLLINNIACLLVCLFVLSGLAFVGTMAILCFTKVFSVAFLGEYRSEIVKNINKDVSKVFTIPMIILASIVFLIGIFPNYIFKFITIPVSQIIDIPDISNITNIMQLLVFVFSGLLVFVLLIFIIKKIFYTRKEKYTTWGCGYNKCTSNMQYSGASYSSPFIKMAMPLFVKITDVKKPKSIFPSDAHYSIRMEDIEESYLLKPIEKLIEKFLTKFEKIQNGNIQYYISIGLIFLLFAIVGVVLLG